MKNPRWIVKNPFTGNHELFCIQPLHCKKCLFNTKKLAEMVDHLQQHFNENGRVYRELKRIQKTRNEKGYFFLKPFWNDNSLALKMHAFSDPLVKLLLEGRELCHGAPCTTEATKIDCDQPNLWLYTKSYIEASNKNFYEKPFSIRDPPSGQTRLRIVYRTLRTAVENNNYLHRRKRRP